MEIEFETYETLTIEKTTLDDLKKANAVLAKALRGAADDIDANKKYSTIPGSAVSQKYGDKYRVIADKYEVKE